MLTEIDLDNTQRRVYPRMYTTVTLDLVRHPDAIQLPAGGPLRAWAEKTDLFSSFMTTR